MNNPLLSNDSLPNFTNINPEHFYPALKKLTEDFTQQMAKVIKQESPSWQSAIQPLEELDAKIDKVFGIISHFDGVLSSDKVREEYEKSLNLITDFGNKIMQSNDLYQVYVRVKSGPEFSHLTTAQQKIIDNAIRNYKLSGVDLPEDKKQQLAVIRTQLSELSNNFSKNVMDATAAWNYHTTNQDELSGIPQDNLDFAADKAKQKQKPGWLLGLDMPTYLAVMTYADNRKLRQKYHHAYATLSSDQGPHDLEWDNGKIVEEILKKRYQLAQIVGFDSFSSYSIAPKMAESSQQVVDFLQDLASRSKNAAQKELKVLEQFAIKDGIDKLEAWDRAYYAEKYKQDNYNISTEELRNYFQEPYVLQGLFKLASQLFSIDITEEENFSKWHDSVKLYTIRDKSGNTCGKFYTDLYARERKRSGAWMSGFQSRIKLANGETVTPAAFVVANFAPPSSDKPALLSHDDVITLFHEFGHAIHHLLTKVDYFSVSGINGVPWDAVELPSQFMENWGWEPEVLSEISNHYITGQELPNSMIEKLIETKKYNAALQMLRQIELAMMDFKLHLANPNNLKIQKTVNEIRSQISVSPAYDYDRMQNSFQHIFSGGYAAGYYSYKWAEVLSADAFSVFQKNGKINPSISNAFLSNILEKGGSEDPSKLFVAFKGSEPSIEPLLEQSGIQG